MFRWVGVGEVQKSKIKPRFWLYKLCEYLYSFPELWRTRTGAGLEVGVGTQDLSLRCLLNI